ncbi:uncharacterized protein LOC134824958 isoform X2 [Bolinopsis microptera]|uniref:uncharacterized protein LOC134824958 isoform X2 n=1 Tax=Bolinopsis microptera TaxID=2820187 RepID=UPI00307A6C1C
MYTSTEPFTTPIICAKIHCMAWLPDPDGGGLLATGNTSSAVSVAIVNEQKQLNNSNSYKVCVLKPVLSAIQHPLRPQLKDVTHVSWSKKYQFLASCHGYNHVLIWDRHGNRVTNKPVVIIRDESQDTSRIVPACTVRWAHTKPTLLITYEDGIMKLVKVTSETNSSHISVDNISFSDAYYNNALYNGAEIEPEVGVKLKSSCWSHHDEVVYSAAENTNEIVVTSVAERRIIAKIPIDTRVEELHSWYCTERGQLLIVHHPSAAITIMNLDSEYHKIEEQHVLTPFSIGSTKMAVRVTDGMIAIGGSVNSLGANMVCIYHNRGSLMKRVVTPCDKPISAICWVGRSSLSVATKNHVHNITVSKSIPSLEFLASQAVTNLQKKAASPKLPVNIRMNFENTKRTLPKNTPRVFSDTDSASQCTLRVVRGVSSLQEAQFMVAEVGGEAVALRAIKQTALMSLGVHYEIMLRNDCMRTDENQLNLINRHSNSPPRVLNCSYSDNFTLALRMSHKPLSRGTTLVSSLGNKSTLFYGLHYSEKRSLLTVHLYNSSAGTATPGSPTENDTAPYVEATGLIHRPAAGNDDPNHTRSVVLLHQEIEVFQLLKWQKGSYSVRYKSPFSMCAAFCTAVSCISRKLI